MKSFASGVFDRQPIGQSLLQTIRLLGEYQGRQDLFTRQSPQVRRTLRQAAIVESTEASNRIEGVLAPRERRAGCQRTSPTGGWNSKSTAGC
jgi:hypothetical protein